MWPPPRRSVSTRVRGRWADRYAARPRPPAPLRPAGESRGVRASDPERSITTLPGAAEVVEPRTLRPSTQAFASVEPATLSVQPQILRRTGNSRPSSGCTFCTARRRVWWPWSGIAELLQIRFLVVGLHLPPIICWSGSWTQRPGSNTMSLLSVVPDVVATASANLENLGSALSSANAAAASQTTAIAAPAADEVSAAVTGLVRTPRNFTPSVRRRRLFRKTSWRG